MRSRNNHCTRYLLSFLHPFNKCLIYSVTTMCQSIVVCVFYQLLKPKLLALTLTPFSFHMLRPPASSPPLLLQPGQSHHHLTWRTTGASCPPSPSLCCPDQPRAPSTPPAAPLGLPCLQLHQAPHSGGSACILPMAHKPSVICRLPHTSDFQPPVLFLLPTPATMLTRRFPPADMHTWPVLALFKVLLISPSS